jgi:hypothetical protein
MRHDIKQEWVKRLRSGIPQVKGMLARGDARCAVGVLCDIAVEHGVTFKVVTPEERTYYGGYRCDAPTPILGWACITRDELRNIECLNDEDCTFEEIATYIENNL